MNWAKRKVRNITLYDPDLINLDRLSAARFARPGEVIAGPPTAIQRVEVPLRSTRFVSHMPGKGLRLKRTVSAVFIHSPQIPPEVFDVPKRWLEIAQSMCGVETIAPGVVWPKRIAE